MWKPISEAPREHRYRYGYEEMPLIVVFPVGTIIKFKDGREKLLGDDLAGSRTQGCDCCSC